MAPVLTTQFHYMIVVGRKRFAETLQKANTDQEHGIRVKSQATHQGHSLSVVLTGIDLDYMNPSKQWLRGQCSARESKSGRHAY